MRHASAIIVALGLSACATAETPQQMQARMDRESAAARTAIDALHARYEAAFNARDFAQTSGMFMEQGVQMPPNSPANVGRAAIRAGDSTFFTWGTSVLGIRTDNVVANGPIAIARGTWTFDFKPNKNAPRGMTAAKDNGKFLTHFHNVNGEWMYAEDIWNSNTPPGPPPGSK